MNRRKFFAFLPLAVVARKMFRKPSLPWDSKTYRFIGVDRGLGDYTCTYILHLRQPEKPGISNLQVIQKHFDHWGNV